MSYCRFSENSDIYAYECDGGVQFWAAGKENRRLDRLCNTFNEAYQYAKALRDEHGLEVPSYAIETLKADAIAETRRINGPHSAIAERIAELESLVRDIWTAYRKPDESFHHAWDVDESLEQRIAALGIEVD